MSSTQQQIQGLLSQYTQSQGQQTRKMSGVGTNSASAAQGSGVLSPLGSSRKGDRSPMTTPERPRKKLKLEEKPPADDASRELRQLICNHKLKKMLTLKTNYRENLLELFFLQNMGNLMDYHTWRRKPDPKVYQYLKSGRLESDDEEDWCSEKSVLADAGSLTPATPSGSPVPQTHPGAGDQRGITERANLFSQFRSASNSPSPAGGSSLLQTKSSTAHSSSSSLTASIKVSGESLTVKTEPGSSSSSTIGHPKSASGSAVPESMIGTQEAIVERAKQEAAVMQRVSELRKEGLWSSRRLPKVQEPSRNKAHWDYLLEEMQWLAADFAQERKWKKAGARKIANMISKYHKEQQQKELKAEKDEVTKLKRVASNIAKMVREFWSNIEKVVEFKQQSRLEEKRKKALDLHLSFIVDQTEKYSSWLTEGLVTAQKSTPDTSLAGSTTADDGDFEPSDEGSDDEETINKEEEEGGMDEDSTRQEVEALQQEMALPFDELLRGLPPEVLDKPASIHSGSEGASEQGSPEKPNRKRAAAEEFCPSESSDDDEETLDKEEENEDQEGDESQELEELAAEGELPLEELVKKYAAAYDSDFEMPSDGDSDDTSVDGDSDVSDLDSDSSDGKEEEENDEQEEKSEVGMEYLMEDLEKDQQPAKEGEPGQGKDLNDIAAAAQSIQPTGYTLETTRVRTAVPFLLKHTLREYQVVGLDWMATMYERRLNGILADEMGLGKTIQTIALLAHLACEKSVWGPHLIVVPTSVMLNWEMEFKKWCPAFKILTYFGTQKERKAKRTGWTKTNAFHVCITSYKLVIQDHQAFRRKKWKYFILDEAQNIKNFKSQRWQTLLNFNSQRRLLLTGTPLQNSLMELWSLMHFLMPNVFQSHREFKEWFANPLTGMIEGSREYNDSLIKRLHKVLRPFLLRRLKQDVEKQMPKKYEHVVRCHLSRRQRFLYDDFMAQTKTKETLATGHYMSVINILMQLRKVCNHPNLFDPRPIISPFQMEGITYHTASLALEALEKHPLMMLDLNQLCPSLAELELKLPAFVAHRIRRLQCPRKLIEEIDSQPEPLPRPTPVDKPLKLVFNTSPMPVSSGRSSPFIPIQQASPAPSKSPYTESPSQTPITTTPSVEATQLHQLPGHTPQIPKSTQPQVSTPTSVVLSSGNTTQSSSSQPITVQIQNTPQGTRLMIPSGQLSQLPGYIQIVQTSSGQQIIATSQPPPNSTTTAVNGPTTSLVSKLTSAVQLPGSGVSTSHKPVMKVPPLQATADTTVTTSHEELKTSSRAEPSQLSSKSVIGATTTGATSLNEATSKSVNSVFFSKKVEGRRLQRKAELIERLARNNKRNCELKPVYGSDLCGAVDALHDTQDPDASRWRGLGYVHCHKVHGCERPNHPNVFWRQTGALRAAVHTPLDYLDLMKDILDRYTFATPAVMAPRIQMRTFHPPPSHVQSERLLQHVLHKQVAPKAACLHRICSNMTVQFPEVRLIQYDCGKLQTLDVLLRQLKSGQHRVLIFTQMTKMLDVLEAFLNYHGHRYLRLDGTTKVEQRQALMERFNADKRIFVFILSTRSGGLGVNLTGADTVVFYDSDWNPTMDAQAQDRCHRIGQTRDVHIYRLISEKTIEENILKKANQKRLLSDVTIEGGNFTTAFFKQNTIHELFEEPSGLEALAAEKNKAESRKAAAASATTTPVVVKAESNKPSTSSKPDGPVPPPPPGGKKAEGEKPSRASRPPSRASSGGAMPEDMIEQALGAAEDEGDVQAAKSAKAEQSAELAEFDENIPWDEKEAEQKKENDEVLSRVEQELAMLHKELTPVERYAVVRLERELAPLQVDELEKAEEEVTLAKEEWELSRLKALKEEEERRAELEEDEMLFTYSREDANKIFMCDETAEQMPIWAPPTPPEDDNDLYIDHSLCFLYEQSVMTETQLPPVYIKKEHKRIRIDNTTAVARKHKVRKEEQPRVPKSLFDRPVSLLRRDAKLKLKQGFGMRAFKHTAPLPSRPVMDSSPEIPDWLIHEDWALLQCIQHLLELPLNLLSNSSGHIANWDIVADVVNSTSRVYRGAKQCKGRYENVIVPREEGRILYDVNPRKQKKTKGIYKVYHTKNNRPMKTSQLYAQDNHQALTTLHNLRFDSSKCISSKRPPTMRPTLANPTLKNPKHAAVLGENGINYEQPLTPVQVAQIRAERIAKEKVSGKLETQQQKTQQQSQQTTAVVQQTATVVTQTVAGQPQLTVVQAAQQQLQAVATAAGTSMVPAVSLQKTATVSAVSLAKGLGATGSIVVNTGGAVPGNAFAINRKVVGSLAQNIIPSTTISSTLATTSSVSVRATPARTIATSMTVQELNAALVNQARAAGQANQSQLLTTSALSQSQLARVSALPQAAGTVQQKVATSTTKLTQQHLLMLQKQQQLRQQQRTANITSLTQIQGQQASAVAQAVQRPSSSTPLITSISGAVTQQGTRVQVPKQALGQRQRTLTEEMAVILRQKGSGQKIQAITGGTQQVQVSGQGAMARLTTQQLIAGTQQVVSSQTAGSVQQQPVATLVKTVSTQGGSVQPSVNIPVSAVNAVSLGITVPQQKQGGRVAPLQVRQIMGQKKQTVTAAQLQAHKVATIGGMQLPKTGGTPLIIPQKNQSQQVIVQQIQQLVQHQSKTNQTAANTATVIAGQTVARLSVPTGSSSTVRTVAPGNLSAVGTAAPSVSLSAAVGTMAPQTLITQAAASNVPSSVALHQGIVKNIQEVGVSPQKAGGVVQQLKSLTSAQTIRGLSSISLTAGGQPTLAVQQIQPSKQQTPPPAVQQAVQQVVQHAQLQSQQRAQQLQQQNSTTAQPGTTTVPAVIVTTTPAQQVGSTLNQQQTTVVDPKVAAAATYAMRLRNQKQS